LRIASLYSPLLSQQNKFLASQPEMECDMSVQRFEIEPLGYPSPKAFDHVVTAFEGKIPASKMPTLP
jgi:hypothetical protein